MPRILYMLLLFGSISCLSETDSTDIFFENDPLKDQHQIYSLKNETHSVELYSRDTILYEGFNELLFQIKDVHGKYIPYVSAEWTINTEDSVISPSTEIKQSTENPYVYTSFLIFPKDTSSKDWELLLNYNIQATKYQIKTKVEVHQPASNRITVEQRTGTDNKEYLLALSTPYISIKGFNNCSLLVYEKHDSKYELSKDLDIQVHLSKEDYPNEEAVALTFREDSRHHGKIELLDYGIWQLNVLVKNKAGEIILGDKESAGHHKDNLHFPLLVKLIKTY